MRVTSNSREEKTQKIFSFSLFFENSTFNTSFLTNEKFTYVEEGAVSLRSKQIPLYVTLCVILSLTAVIGVGADDTIVEDPIIVFFDEGHGQFFNHSLYSKAISDLRTNNMEIIYNSEEFNSSSFEGVDIFVSTNPQEFYSSTERYYLSNFINQGKSMFLLANPLNEDNESLNGHGDIFNDLLTGLSSEAISSIGSFWTYSDSTDSIKQTDVVLDEFSNDTGYSKYLLLELNSSSHEILSTDKNITSIVTYSCSIIDPRTQVILAPQKAYAETILGEIHSYSSDIVLLGSSGEPDIGTRILLGGSSVMFSDLSGPFSDLSWYESENNSLLWLNIFNWLSEQNPETLPPQAPSEQILLLLILMTTIAIFLFLGGSVSFMVGSGRKISIVKSGEEIAGKPKPQFSAKEAMEPISEEVSSPSKETKRARRLKQVKKNRRSKRK